MTDEQALKAARAEGKALVANSAATRTMLRALTAAMKLDLLLFGRIESGPFFALLERTEDGVGNRTTSHRSTGATEP